MSRDYDKPLNRPALAETAPTACRQCWAPFAEGWPTSRWTLSGWSPWCPACHASYAPQKYRRRKPGPKPKGWTNLPIN
jgi:hypothetical protein